MQRYVRVDNNQKENGIVLASLRISSVTHVDQTKNTILLQTFWDNSPGEFETKDSKEIAGSIGLTIPTAERYIRAWTGDET